jgi:cation-transporting P-type ATPase E
MTSVRDSNVTGLNNEEVEQRILAGQVNTAPPSTGRSLIQIARANVFTRFNAILGSLFVVVAFVGPVQDGLFGIVLVANTAIGVFQELRAKVTLERLAILSAPRAHVRRRDTLGNGALDMAVSDVVLDDVLELRPGDQVPIDAVVLESMGLEIDESLLSGEPDAVTKFAGDSVLSGSFVVAGSGVARATAVGADAYAVRLQAEAARFSLLRSQLQEGTNSILRMVTWVMIPVGAALVASQLLRSHQSFSDAVRASVAGVGAMVPEGLVLLTSIAFAVGAVRLASERVLVQELAAIEGLARTDVLCIDKTGTLTTGSSTFEAIFVAAGFKEERLREVLSAFCAADPTPNATLQAIGGALDIAPDWRIESRVPFSSARKWSAVNFVDHGSWVLGAPSMVVAELPESLARERAQHESMGHRVVLLAECAPPVSNDGPLVEAVAAGLIVLAEKLRDEAASTIEYLSAQGVAVIVLSGDAPATVGAIATKVGIATAGTPRDATHLSDANELAMALETSNIFGRVRPDQKVEAVRALQSRGHVVAMIGDGVNDVQALKQADLGIAMGSGSQSSRSVSRMVLLDDSFAAVPKVLAEGRRVVANIERVANLFVTKTVYASLLAISVVLLAVPYPFFPRHLTIVSTLTIGVPGFFLALAKSAPRSTPGFVAKVLSFTLPVGAITGLATLGVYEAARLSHATSDQQHTLALLELCALGFAVLVLVARPLNALRLTLVVMMAGALVASLSIGWTRRVFALSMPGVNLSLLAGLTAIAAIVLILVTLGTTMWWSRWWARRASATRH